MVHPMATEKLLTLALHDGTEEDIFSKGRVTFRGYPGMDCQEEEEE